MENDRDVTVITCFISYTIDPSKVAAFEDYARRWMQLIPAYGGIHHGYFLPHEGASDQAIALFSFACLADYEAYREKSRADHRCTDAYDFAAATGCILRYTRAFLRPCPTTGDALVDAP